MSAEDFVNALNDKNMFDPEYVTVFGIPFSFLPIEGNEKPKGPEKPKVLIECLKSREDLQIFFPNVLRINRKINTLIDIELFKYFFHVTSSFIKIIRDVTYIDPFN